MNIERELTLHIGWPKTGTSALQTFFAMNMQNLLDGGCLYPELFDLTNAKKGLDGQGNAYSLAYSYLPNKSITNCSHPEISFESIATHLSSDHSKVLLSTEWFTLLDESSLEDLKALAERFGRSVKIIAYLRRQDQFLESSYTQKVKFGQESRIADEFVYQVDYRPCLSKFEQVFGRKSIIIRRYGRNYFSGGNIFSDFLETLKLTNATNFIKPPKAINSSAHPSVINLCRELAALGETPEIIQSVYSKSSFKSSEESFSWLSNDHRLKLLSNCSPQNREISQKYMTDKLSPLFSNEIIEYVSLAPASDQKISIEDMNSIMNGLKGEPSKVNTQAIAALMRLKHHDKSDHSNLELNDEMKSGSQSSQ